MVTCRLCKPKSPESSSGRSTNGGKGYFPQSLHRMFLYKLVQFQLPPLCWVSSNGKSVCSEGQKILGSIPSLVICLCSSVLVERWTEDPSVAGSIPAGGTNMVLSASGQGHLVLSQVTTVRICIGLLKYGDVE